MRRLLRAPGAVLRATLCFFGHHVPKAQLPMPRLGGGYETYRCAHCQREWDWQWT